MLWQSRLPGPRGSISLAELSKGLLWEKKETQFKLQNDVIDLTIHLSIGIKP